MLWLVWHMWILIGLAFAGGVIAGWVARGRSDETPERSMLERLDATVVAPVADPKPAASPEPAAVQAPELEPEPEAEPETEPEPETEAASDAEPAPEAEAQTDAASEKAEPDGAPAAAAEADDLTAIKGLGPKAAEKLNAEGVTRFADIASWTAPDVERFDALINGRGRITRDEWVKQAKALAKG
jgi:predicted flap endonuclease-1-like 5' DNA nuclease